MNQRSNDTPGETIAARISRILADRIIAGEIEPGIKLRQDHIAEEFETSHVPVREAFRRLEAQGLVVSEPRRGVRVASFDISEIREVAEMRAARSAGPASCSAPYQPRHAGRCRTGNPRRRQVTRCAKLGRRQSSLSSIDSGAMQHAAPAGGH